MDGSPTGDAAARGGAGTRGAVTTVEVLGRELRLPMRIAAARAAGGAFSADADAVAATVPDGLAPLRWRPGRAVVLVMAVDYRDNPLGTYDEVVVAPLVAPTGTGRGVDRTAVLRGHVGLLVLHMPVSEAFTCTAGRQLWGYPKTVDELTLDLGRAGATARWAREGVEVLRLTAPGWGRLRAPRVRGTTFTSPAGALLRTPLGARARGLSLRPGGAQLHLGPGASDLGLDRLDLDRRSLAGAGAGHVEMVFDAARPVRGGAPA